MQRVQHEANTEEISFKNMPQNKSIKESEENHDQDNSLIQNAEKGKIKGFFIPEKTITIENNMTKARQKGILGKRFLISNKNKDYLFFGLNRKPFNGQPYAKQIDLTIIMQENKERQISQAIRETLKISKSLQNLNLVLSRQLNITDFDFYTIAGSICFMPLLESLHVLADHCTNMTDGSLAVLGQNIKTLKKLKDLRLDFGWNNMFTDFGFNTLGLSLKNVTTLKSLLLNFPQCESITSKGLSLFCQSIVSLDQIEDFKLNLLW